MPKQGKPQVSRDHHYVSAGYLAQFTNTQTKKGLFYALDFSTNKFFRPRPADVASEIDYNRIEVPNLPPDALETALGGFEGRAIREIRSVCKTGKLPDMDAFSYIYNLVTLFAVKSPAIRNATENTRVALYREIMEISTSSPAKYEQGVERAKAAGFIRPDLNVSYERAKDFLRRDAFTITIPNHSHVAIELGIFDRLLPLVAQRYWSVMNVKPGAPDLITCDRPAPPRLGDQTIFFTISPRHALLGEIELGAPAEFEISDLQVAHINTELLKQANAQIYSRTDQIALLKNGRPGVLDMRQAFPAQSVEKGA